MVFEANAKISIHELCRGADDKDVQLTDERINITNYEQCTVCNESKNQNEKCHKDTDYRELFHDRSKQEGYFWFQFSIHAWQTGKTFCYFCISEYNPSSRKFKFNDMGLIEYGKVDDYTNSTLDKWQIINRDLSDKNIGHRMIRTAYMKNASGRISIMSRNAIYVN